VGQVQEPVVFDGKMGALVAKHRTNTGVGVSSELTEDLRMHKYFWR